MHNQNRALRNFIQQKLIKASAEAHFKCIQFTILTFNDSRSLSNLLMLILRSSCKSTWGYFFVKLLKFFIHGQGPDWIELGKSTKLKLDKLLLHWPCCVVAGAAGLHRGVPPDQHPLQGAARQAERVRRGGGHLQRGDTLCLNLCTFM